MKKSMKTECADRIGGNRQKEDVEKAEEETDTDRQIETSFGYPSVPSGVRVPYGNKMERIFLL